MPYRRILTFAVGLTLASDMAEAEESMRIIATSGAWTAFTHSPSLVAPPDVCVVASKGFGLRVDENSLQIRFTDSTWSLPANVAGDIVLSVGSWAKTVGVSDNTDTMVNADVEREDMIDMLGAMDKASTMTVTVGNAKPVTISLAGSTRVTNAFRTCARLQGSAEVGGANPFK